MLKISNYDTARSGHTRQLTLETDDREWLERCFPENRCRLQSWDEGKRELTMTGLVAGRPSWSWFPVEQKSGAVWRVGIPHSSSSLPVFGRTRLEEMPLGHTIRLPQRELLRPTKTRHGGPRAPETLAAKLPPAPSRTTVSGPTTLREAVEAINRHKEQLGDELALSVSPSGYLRALIEYGQ